MGEISNIIVMKYIRNFEKNYEIISHVKNSSFPIARDQTLSVKLTDYFLRTYVV